MDRIVLAQRCAGSHGGVFAVPLVGLRHVAPATLCLVAVLTRRRGVLVHAPVGSLSLLALLVGFAPPGISVRRLRLLPLV